MKYQELGKGVIRRTKRRVLGLFIDGTGLDRATRRINRKVDMSNLVRGVASGLEPTVARYYTLIPYEDDSRQRAFLDAVARAGLQVIVKRLPPKGVSRQVSVDVEMASDIVAFARGLSQFSDLSEYKVEDFGGNGQRPHSGGALPSAAPFANQKPQPSQKSEEKPKNDAATSAGEKENQPTRDEERIVTIVCPSRDLAYPISMVKELGSDTVTADFGQFKSSDVLKSAAKWIDLSDSETIWRD